MNYEAGRRMPPRQAVRPKGEIRVRGPMVFRGYTDAALTADAFDADGFFRTGDLGRPTR